MASMFLYIRGHCSCPSDTTQSRANRRNSCIGYRVRLSYFRTSVLCVCWCSFSAFWRAENTISVHRSISLQKVHTEKFRTLGAQFLCYDLKYTQSAISHGDQYKQAYWKHRPLHLNVRFIVKSDSRFPYPCFCRLRLFFHSYVFTH